MGANAYEEARKLIIQDNQKKLEEFGLSKMAKSLAELNKTEKKPKQLKQNHKPKEIVEPRRSSRARNTVVSYRDDLDIGLPLVRKSRTNSSPWGGYVARPLDEIKLCSYEERAQAMKAAETLQSKLQSGNPSFVKSMVRSHVYSCFWLGLPADFCKTHLKSSVSKLDMVLEDESGKEFDAIYIGERVGLSGGWRAFALEHKLDDGDALVFELIDPTRFKIYITRVSSFSSQEYNVDVQDKEAIGAKASQTRKKMKISENGNMSSPDESKPQNEDKEVIGAKTSGRQKRMKKSENGNLSSPEESKPRNEEASEGRSKPVKQSKKRKIQNKSKQPNTNKSQAESDEDKDDCVSKKPVERKEKSFRRRVR